VEQFLRPFKLVEVELLVFFEGSDSDRLVGSFGGWLASCSVCVSDSSLL
jgi:hypothetical protein